MSKSGQAEFNKQSFLFRDYEQEYMMQVFKPVLKYPEERTQRVWITGGISTGKSSMIKWVFQFIQRYSDEFDLKIKCVHINCRRNRKFSLIAHDILKKVLDVSLPRRGYSSFEYLNHLIDSLTKKGVKLIIALDEFEYLVNHNYNDAVDILTQLDESPISVIVVGKDRGFSDRLPIDIKNSLGFHFNLRKYNYPQLIQILQIKVEQLDHDEPFREEILELITELVYTNHCSDIRFAMNFLQQILLFTEKLPHQITIQDVVKIYSKYLIKIGIEDVFNLPKKYITRLLEIAKALQINKSISLTKNQINLTQREIDFLVNDGFLYRHSNGTFSILFTTLNDLITTLSNFQGIK